MITRTPGCCSRNQLIELSVDPLSATIISQLP